ncbi:hypothetical protein VNI00_001573 [Paramarasmius palmivorus]|uniref:BZIP domain-containing protein n=1 Tax=Paramarasmius palmivorus TaxID=297713 RepID=A0AAW0E7C4_9AGAR
MPKAPAGLSYSPSSAKSGDMGKISDVAIRKKKNADAQAAFRARRANYITTLEETVNNLEAVVLQLQESCRDARNEVVELRQENNHLRHALRERENFWRAVWPRKGHSANGEPVDFPPPPTLAVTLSPTSFSNMGPTSQIPQYSDPAAFREDTPLPSQYTTPTSTSNPTHSPTVSFSTAESDMQNQRASKYPYFSTNTQDGTWTHSTSSDPCMPIVNHSSNSPHFTESPTLASSEVAYSTRFVPQSEEQKTSMAMSASIDSTSYMPMIPASRSLSPSVSTPPSNSAQIPQFAFGTDSVANDGARYAASNQRPEISADRTLLPVLPPLSSGSDNGSQHERGSNDGDSGSYSNKRARLSGNAGSRSPSPSATPLSGTLAVIKAQAFGALRRTRVRTKKPTDTAAKVSMDVLEARGLGVSAGTKRRRDESELDLPS